MRHESGQPLPFREAAYVEWNKIRNYYLADAGPSQRNSKVGLFTEVLGFADPWSVRAALVAHGRMHPAYFRARTEHGDSYNVIGPFVGANERRIEWMITGWIIAPGSVRPRNITAFPAPRTRG